MYSDAGALLYVPIRAGERLRSGLRKGQLMANFWIFFDGIGPKPYLQRITAIDMNAKKAQKAGKFMS